MRRNSTLYERLRPQWQNRPVDASLTERDWARAVDYASADFHRNLTAFTVVARSMGAKVVLAEINRLTGDRPPQQFTQTERATWQRAFATPPDVLHQGYTRFRDVWKSVADSAGATFVSADSMAITGPQYFCENDPIHFNTRGSDMMARRMAEVLIARHVVTPASAQGHDRASVRP